MQYKSKVKTIAFFFNGAFEVKSIFNKALAFFKKNTWPLTVLVGKLYMTKFQDWLTCILPVPLRI